jgi:ribosomal protein L11 methyltransferase
MKWVEVAIQAGEAAIDAVSNILIEEGCGGTVIGPTLSRSSAANRVAGYLPVDDRLETRLLNIRERVRLLPGYGLPLDSDEVTITPVADEEWATAWKKHFKPVRIGRIIVKPSWEPVPAEDAPSTSSVCSGSITPDVVVDIDPGMAFGTGYHPTTQLCLQVLQEIVRGSETVLDVGTGSGLLAIAAVKLGAHSAVGLDIDSVAVEVAEENVRQAGLSEAITIERADSPSAFDGQADIVFANIIAKVLVEMADALAEKLAAGGKLVASGIVTERADQVRDAFRAAGLAIVDERTDGEWVALVCERAA